jgi:hypothetical protein
VWLKHADSRSSSCVRACVVCVRAAVISGESNWEQWGLHIFWHILLDFWIFWGQSTKLADWEGYNYTTRRMKVIDLKSDIQFLIILQHVKVKGIFFCYVRGSRFLIITHDKIKRFDNRFLALIWLTASLSFITIWIWDNSDHRIRTRG